MSIVDIAQKQVTNSDKANEIREHLASVISIADVKLLQIRNIVRDVGKANISTELGSDAADMLTVYTKLKEAIETAKNVTVEELPS